MALFWPIRISLLSCLAAACFSGSRVAIPVETPGCVQEAAANGGFASRTHRGSEAVQGTAAIRLMAIVVWPSWLCFVIFHFLWSAIRLDFARRQPRQAGEPAGSTGTQHSAPSTQHSYCPSRRSVHGPHFTVHDDGVSSLGPSRLAVARLHATKLRKTARTIPANGVALMQSRHCGGFSFIPDLLRIWACRRLASSVIARTRPASLCTS